jgi:2-succinyl-5-enolpyruvyl-6-hydroxy-3-cyclohexene-1-carboxylate synthase
VHCNLAFREPLLPTGAPLVDAPGRADGEPWTRSTPASARRAPPTSRASRRGARLPARVAGRRVGRGRAPATAARFRRARAGRCSPTRSRSCASRHAISTYEALLRAPGFAAAHRPDLVAARRRAAHEQGRDRVARTVVAAGARRPARRWLDPQHAASERSRSTPMRCSRPSPTSSRTGASPWLDDWQRAERRPRSRSTACSTPRRPDRRARRARPRRRAARRRHARRRVEPAGARARVVHGARAGLRVLANRGANGIDGFVSTVVGVAQRTARPTVGLCGDLCFLHDTNGLLGATAPATFVVRRQRRRRASSPTCRPPSCPSSSGCSRRRTASTSSRSPARTASPPSASTTCASSSRPCSPADGPRVLVIPVDRAASVARHRALWDAVAASQ